jgi:hypothetical protein
VCVRKTYGEIDSNEETKWYCFSSKNLPLNLKWLLLTISLLSTAEEARVKNEEQEKGRLLCPLFLKDDITISVFHRMDSSLIL